MSYLVCEECGRYYELDEGKSSFSYEKCPCGGRLRYSDSIKVAKNNSALFSTKKSRCPQCGEQNPKDSIICSSCGNEMGDVIQQENLSRQLTRGKRGISWLGIAVGFGFLMLSSLISVLAIFGTNVPQKPEDIQYNLLVAFGIITVFVTIVSGLISSYIGGSSSYKQGIINGGLVGVILGLLIGVSSGSITFIGVIAVFGSLAVLGGIIGTFLVRRS